MESVARTAGCCGTAARCAGPPEGVVAPAEPALVLWRRAAAAARGGALRLLACSRSELRLGRRRRVRGDEPEEAADAAGADVDDAPDPMDALSDVEVDQQIANPQPKRRRRSVTQKTEVAVVRMTRLPPCDDEYDANDLVDVKCLRKGGRGGASPIHISVSNLTWLLTYVQSELVHLSVCEEQPELDLDAESSAAADYTIQWDFQQSHFRATVRTGDHAGKERTLHPDHIGGYRLARAKEHACDQSLGRREAAKIFLASWCKAVIANDDASFEANWSDSGGGDTPAGSSTCAATDSPGDSFASSQVQQSGSSDAPAVAGPHHELTQSEGPAVTTSHGSHNQSPSSPHPSTSAVADMDLGCLSRPLKKALTAKPTCSHSSIGTCRRSMSSGRGDGGSSWPMIIRRTSLQQYLHCVGRAAMSSFRMAAVSRLLLKRQTLISTST